MTRGHFLGMGETREVLPCGAEMVVCAKRTRGAVDVDLVRTDLELSQRGRAEAEEWRRALLLEVSNRRRARVLRRPYPRISVGRLVLSAYGLPLDMLDGAVDGARRVLADDRNLKPVERRVRMRA